MGKMQRRTAENTFIQREKRVGSRKQNIFMIEAAIVFVTCALLCKNSDDIVEFSTYFEHTITFQQVKGAIAKLSFCNNLLFFFCPNAGFSPYIGCSVLQFLI
jgi:hypothetical protein